MAGLALGATGVVLAVVERISSAGSTVLLCVVGLLGLSLGTLSSSLFFLTPSVTAVMAWALLRQPLSPLTVAGLAVSGAGVALATRAASSRA